MSLIPFIVGLKTSLKPMGYKKHTKEVVPLNDGSLLLVVDCSSLR